MKRAHRFSVWLPITLFVVLSGCKPAAVSPPPPTGEDVLIVSGLGVPGYCEIGMKAKEIKRKCPFIQAGEWSACHKVTLFGIPEWGIKFSAGKKPVTCLIVTTVSVMPDFPAFKGNLDGLLLFANNVVDRETIVDIYGQPVLFGDSFLAFPDETRPYSIVSPSAPLEYIFYLRRGIIFILYNNVVKSFLIVQPQEDKNINEPSFTPSAPPREATVTPKAGKRIRTLDKRDGRSGDRQSE